MVWDLVCQQRRRLCLEFLPAYAPELNPVEYLWHTGSTMSYRTSVPTAMENSATMLANDGWGGGRCWYACLAAGRIVFVVYM